MQTKIVQLPSGAKINLRKMTLADQNHLASSMRSKRSEQEQVLLQMIDRCSDGYDDPGPYPYEAGDKINWKKMLQGDYLAALIELRKYSFREGNNYHVDLTCPSCNHKFGWTVDLQNDLYYQQLPIDSAEKIKKGEPFEVEIAGKMVSYNLGFVGDQEAVEKLAKRFPGRDVSIMCRARIVKVDGVDPKDMMNWLDGEGNGPYPGLDADEAEELREAFSAVDCGVDTEVEAVCPRMTCGNSFSFALPLAGMLTPGRALAKRKQARLRTEDSSED